MTLPRLDEIHEAWRIVPPLTEVVARFLGAVNAPAAAAPQSDLVADLGGLLALGPGVTTP